MEIEKRKQGRPIGKNFTVLKQLKINEEQNKNWNRNTPKLIRDLLEGKLVSIELLKQLYNIMNNKMIPKEKLTDEEKKYLIEIGDVLKDE